MTIDTTEKKFEESIESVLLKGDYIKRKSSDFNKEFILDSELFFRFLESSQKKDYDDLEQNFGIGTKDEILRALEKQLNEEGMISVLRNGFSVYDIHLDCVYFMPVSERSEESQENYEKNILSIARQVRYNDEGKSVDLLLCVNGLPVATGEIKNPATGQSFEDAIKQYKEDRNPNDKLFSFKRGALVHFAIDPHEIHMTTKLQQVETKFLPFNKGRDEGKGNPDNPDGYRTSYLWEQIWQKDQWLEIIGDFIDLQTIEQKSGNPKEVLIFPRYHQLKAVRRLVESTKEFGTGTNYLIQHSTGSGKSNTIAWLAYKLFSLHNDQNNAIFDGIVVLSDRVGIVNQLGNTMNQFEQTSGTIIEVEYSTELAEILQTQRKIVISTQQKFPYALKHLDKVKGKYFAIIIDEAHSSQTGDSATKVRKVLTTNLDEEEKIELKIEESTPDIVDKIEKEMEMRGPQKTLSYYAFTATPKAKTRRLFGTKVSENVYEPFDVYSMKQAIQEGFILDVLKRYTTYERQFKIIRTAAEDKVVEGKKASRALLNYVDLHHLNLKNKSLIIVEHFKNHTQRKIGNLAKAMVVSSSRLQVLKYKQEIDECIKERGYKIKTLVAFSGTLKDELGNTFTERSINKTNSERELTDKFNSPEYNILIVAEKYQTGYDQPLLHTMYVDKKLHGVKAVQTLSRLNRTYPGKTETLVIDFQNTIDDIYASFKPYYIGTSLIDKTDQAYLFKLYDEILKFEIINELDLVRFAKTFYKSLSEQTDADLGRLYAAVDPVLTKILDLTTEGKNLDLFKAKISKYIESYSFLSQIILYDDTQLEKLFGFLKFLFTENLIQNIGSTIPELNGDVSLKWYRLEKTHEGTISLGEEDHSVTLDADYGTSKKPDVLTSLSDIIRKMNERFGGNFSDGDSISLESWIKKLKDDPELRIIAQNKKNTFQDFFRHFEEKFMDVLSLADEPNQILVDRIYKTAEFQKQLIMGASQLYYEWAKENHLPPITPSNPARNRAIFRETIYKCKGFVNWLDLYLNKDAIDFMIDSFDRKQVKEIKLLTSLYDNEYAINEKLLEKIKTYQAELKQEGINLEFRVLATKSGHDRVAHDRYLLGQNAKFNVVSFTLLQKGRFSEIKKTENEIPFTEYWEDSDSFDIIKDWEKIKGLVMFDVNCSDCGKKTQVPFKPDGKRPVYCKDCLPKHRK